MVLRINDKKAIVSELAEITSQSVSAIAADYRGLNVSHMTNLRIRAREQGVVLRVFRNTLAKRAIAETNFDCLREVLVGPIVLLFSQNDPGAAARLLRDFSKQVKELEIRGIALEGQFLRPEQLQAVANLPTREQALSTLLGTMMAPMAKLAQTSAELYAQVVRVVGAVRDKKQAA